MKKIICYLILFTLCINANINSIDAQNLISLHSISACIIDAASGRVLYEKNGFDKRANASTTKILTLILALENCNINDIVTVSEYASKMPDVQLGINEGEQYELQDLMYSMMLESHNDSAVAIAEHVSGSVEEFSNLMNQKAKELGLKDTYFITPNGLDAADKNNNHHTTAVDLSLILRYCTHISGKRDDFINICRTSTRVISDITGARKYELHNKNRFLDLYEDAFLGKTGYTSEAGYCYICEVKRDNKAFIIALLGAGWPNNKNYKWEDARKLADYAFKNYKEKILIDNNHFTYKIPIINGVNAEYIYTNISNSYKLLVSEFDIINIKIRAPKEIVAPININQKVGDLDIYINNKLFDTIDIYSNSKVKERNLKYYLNIIINKYFDI